MIYSRSSVYKYSNKLNCLLSVQITKKNSLRKRVLTRDINCFFPAISGMVAVL